jgi:hypothetical protein
MAKIELYLPDDAENLFYYHNAQIFYKVIKEHAKWLKIYAKENIKLDPMEAHKNLTDTYKKMTGISLR